MGALFGLIGLLLLAVSFIGLIIAIIKKKDKRRYLICMAASLFLFVVGVAITPTSDDSTSDRESDSSDIQQASQPDTSEQDAQKLLDDAKGNFESGSYTSAIKKCDKIKNEYSDTEVAASVDQFIVDQYSNYPNLTAEELCQQYDANEVNADNTYKGNPVIVTGKISDIGKTDITKSIYVLLDDGKNYSFVSVQCDFADSQSDAVAQLQIGSNIKVVGTCGGEGAIVENVMLSDCIVLS